MDNILEILIPLIFAAIYFFGNIFSGQSDGNSVPSNTSDRQEEDPDSIERQRKVQEEIRRKIAQRRFGEGSRTHLDVPSFNPAPEERQPQINSFESQMQERIQRIEATEKRAEKLKQQVRISRDKTTFRHNPPRIACGNARSTLRDPSAARTAFIYGEILGQPISQRRTQTIPGLIN